MRNRLKCKLFVFGYFPGANCTVNGGIWCAPSTKTSTHHSMQLKQFVFARDVHRCQFNNRPKQDGDERCKLRNSIFSQWTIERETISCHSHANICESICYFGFYSVNSITIKTMLKSVLAKTMTSQQIYGTLMSSAMALNTMVCIQNEIEICLHYNFKVKIRLIQRSYRSITRH